MTISLTAHIRRGHFADVHTDNKHKSPLIKRFTDGYTADVVPRLLQCYILQLPDVSPSTFSQAKRRRELRLEA